MKNLVIFLGIVIVILSGTFVYLSSIADAPGPEQLTEKEFSKNNRNILESTDPISSQEEDISSLPPTKKVRELPDSDTTVCTMDAKVCTDGSFVGRTGPDCSFSPCPSEISDSTPVVCTEQMKNPQACTEEYVPVCGLVQERCIAEPCNPLPETFNNDCFACMQENVTSYTEGECLLEVS